MTFLKFCWPFKSKEVFKYSELEIAHLDGFSKGFDLGVQMASEIDSKVKDKIRNQAIEEALVRLHGNDKKNH